MHNIAIVEQHYHIEYLTTILQLLEKRFDTDKIDIYVSKNLRRKLPNRFRFNTKLNFIYTFHNIEAHDIIFLNTIQPSMKDFNFWSTINFLPGTRIFLTLHNLNAWKNEKFILRKNILHSIDSYIARKHCVSLLSKVTDLIVVSKEMVPHARIRFNREISFIPFKLADNVTDDNHENINFSIAGSFDEKRRDYQPIFETFDSLYKTYSNIKLYILGKDPYCYEHKRKHPYLECSDIYKSQETYDIMLEGSDFIICPSVEETYSVNTATELYGITKSFSYFDAVKKRKPIIIPYYLETPTGFEDCVIRYDNSFDLYYKIINFIKSDKLSQIKETAKKDLEVYSLQKIQPFFDTLVFPMEKKAD